MRRPSIPPSQPARVLQYRTRASDEQAMECVARDLRWKIALGLPVDHQGWHPTSSAGPPLRSMRVDSPLSVVSRRA
jgi:hypothetical protein